MTRDLLPRLARAWLLTFVVDGLFSSALTVFAYNATFASLWQRVASVPLGPTALEGGSRTVLIGLLIHCCVALSWSTVFLVLTLASSWLRRVIAEPGGVLKVAVVYGPFVWIMMSWVIIPRFTGRPPTINVRWWVQFFGHIPFVAIPIVWMIRSTPDRIRRASLAHGSA